MAAGRAAFIQAHSDRYKDARALLQTGRWGGAIYLGGYVIECLLKARILKDQGAAELPKDYWHHDLFRLMDVSRVTWEISHRQNQDIQAYVTLIAGNWDVTMRYGSTQLVNRHQATNFLEAVKKVSRWLLELLRSR